MKVTTIEMHGHPYEVVEEEGAEIKVYVLIYRRAGRFGVMSGPSRRTIKPQSQNWKRAIRLAKEAA